MSDRSLAAQGAARAAAVAVSLGLFAFVIINAQFGCDAPATNAPPEDRTGDKAEAKRSAEPQPDETAPANSVAQPSAEPKPDPAAEPEANPEAKSEPVFMPASKSGGDFGSMRFPGETAQQAPQQQLQQNPAPQR